MVDIKLNAEKSGYDVIGEYIRRYWDHHSVDNVICSIGTSYDGMVYYFRNEVASPIGFDDIEFLYDWWEGEEYIKLLGIRSINMIDISDGIYTED